MAETEPIAGGTGSDPLRCDACGRELDVVANVTAGGEAFDEACAVGREEPIVDDIGVFRYLPEYPRVARFCIFKVAEHADPSAVVEETKNPLPRQQTGADAGSDGGKPTNKSRMNREYIIDSKWAGRSGSKNHLLNGHL